MSERVQTTITLRPEETAAAGTVGGLSAVHANFTTREQIEAASTTGSLEIGALALDGGPDAPPIVTLSTDISESATSSDKLQPDKTGLVNLGHAQMKIHGPKPETGQPSSGFTDASGNNVQADENGRVDLGHAGMRTRGSRPAPSPGFSDAKLAADTAMEAYLASLQGSSLVALAKEHSFISAFGGSLSMRGSYHLKPLALKDNPYQTATHGRIPSKNGFSRAWETGANVGDLVENRPFDRYKFYLSLDLSTPQKQAQAQEFIKEVHALAREQKLSMLTKTEDHNYDSCNIYTWSPDEFSGILQQVYKKYPDIWLSVEHPLQGAIDAVDPKHIGYVQEPIVGLKGSHSARMVALGRFIDANDGRLSSDVWQQACKEAGVRPDAPWLIDPALREGYLRKMRAEE